MKISLNWLTDYVKINLPAKQLAELFMRIGFNVETIEETDSDIVIDLEVTSNRPDLLGHVGVARELAAATGEKFTPPVIPALPTQGKAAELTSVQVLDGDLCPRYTARVIRGVKVGPSPAWMVERLAAVGLRSINNVVDVTNYVLMEYSQPLHSFDYDKLGERRIVVRRAKDGEMMVSIDQTKCQLDRNMLVIADAARPVAIAGIMGGLESEVTAATVNVLLESAQFDPLTTRRTSRKLGIMSDSNYRFERGIDPVGVDEASLRACQLIIQLAGGELAEGIVDVWAKPHQAVQVSMRPARTNSLLGIEIPADRQGSILARLGLSPRAEGDKIVCTIPPFRRDLYREIDLIEEVARLEGFDKIPVAGAITHPVNPKGLVEKIRQQAAGVLAAASFDEAVTISFVDAREAELFGFAKPICTDTLVRKTNNALRPTVLPSLLGVCKGNQDAGNADVSLYELATVFPLAAGQKLPAEHMELAMATTADLAALRGAVEALVAQIAPKASLDVRQAPVAGFAEAAAEVYVNGERLGVLGAITPAVLDHYGLEKPIAAAAVNFNMLAKLGGAVRRYQPVPRFPAIRRDLSVIVDESVTWRQLSEAIAAVAQPMRVALDYVTTYRGKPIPDGRKSVTATLTYRWNEGTLRSEQVDEQVSQVVAALKQSLGAELRA